MDIWETARKLSQLKPPRHIHSCVETTWSLHIVPGSPALVRPKWPATPMTRAYCPTYHRLKILKPPFNDSGPNFPQNWPSILANFGRWHNYLIDFRYCSTEWLENPPDFKSRLQLAVPSRGVTFTRTYYGQSCRSHQNEGVYLFRFCKTSIPTSCQLFQRGGEKWLWLGKDSGSTGQRSENFGILTMDKNVERKKTHRGLPTQIFKTIVPISFKRPAKIRRETLIQSYEGTFSGLRRGVSISTHFCWTSCWAK